jgi:hypothetical protein
MKKKVDVEVILKGVFTTIDVYLEGKEVPLREIDTNIFQRIFKNFEITNCLDIHVLLKGWTGMEWSLIIKVDNLTKLEKTGEFDKKGYVSFSESLEA